MEKKLNVKIANLLLDPIYEAKKKELERLMDLDKKNNPTNFSYRSWVIIFQTLDFIFRNTPIHIYNRNKQVKNRNENRKAD